MQFRSISYLFYFSWHLYGTSSAATIQSAYHIAANNNDTSTTSTPLPLIFNQTTNLNLTDTYYYFLPNDHLLELDLLPIATAYLPAADATSVLNRASKALGKMPADVPLSPGERYEIGADRTISPHNEVEFVIEPTYEQTLTWADVGASVEGLIGWLASADEGPHVDKHVTTFFYYQGFEESGVPKTLGYGALKRKWQPFPPEVGRNFTTAW